MRNCYSLLLTIALLWANIASHSRKCAIVFGICLMWFIFYAKDSFGAQLSFLVHSGKCPAKQTSSQIYTSNPWKIYLIKAINWIKAHKVMKCFLYAIIPFFSRYRKLCFSLKSRIPNFSQKLSNSQRTLTEPYLSVLLGSYYIKSPPGYLVPWLFSWY